MQKSNVLLGILYVMILTLAVVGCKQPADNTPTETDLPETWTVKTGKTGNQK